MHGRDTDDDQENSGSLAVIVPAAEELRLSCHYTHGSYVKAIFKLTGEFNGHRRVRASSSPGATPRNILGHAASYLK
jgi:hypothetical protein